MKKKKIKKELKKKVPKFCNCGTTMPNVSFMDNCTVCGGKIW